jgi:hypothetical protein
MGIYITVRDHSSSRGDADGAVGVADISPSMTSTAPQWSCSSPVLLIGAGSCRERSASRVCDCASNRRALGRALDGDLCSARECPARGGRPGYFSRSRSPRARCGGNCLPAGAGLLTWWRRCAQRAPARQGAACRPPRSRRGCPPSPSGSGTVPAPARAIPRYSRVPVSKSG